MMRFVAALLCAISAAAQTPARIVVTVVDDLCLDSAGILAARERLAQVLDRLAPADRMAILRTSGGSGPTRRLTTDRELLKDLINDIEFTGGVVTRQGCGIAAWSVITQTLTGLAAYKGHKSLLLLSGALPAPSGNAAAEIQRLAAAGHTTIYQSSAGATLEQVLATPAANLTDGPPPSGGLVFSRPSNTEVVATMSSPFAEEVAIQVTPLFSNSPEKNGKVEVVCHVEVRDLGFLRDERGHYHLDFDTSFGSALVGGRVVDPITVNHVLDLSEAEYLKVRADGVVVVGALSSWVVGARDVRAAIVDNRSGRKGTASAFVEVPAMATAVALSGIAVEGGPQVRKSPAVRQFQAGDKIDFTYFIYNATSDSLGKSRVETQAKLFTGGREVLAGKISMLEFPPSLDAAHRQVKGQISLDPSIGPGRYILVVAVKDVLANPQHSAGQFIDFEVVK